MATQDVSPQFRERVSAALWFADLYATDGGFQLETFGRGATAVRRLLEAGFEVTGYEDDRLYDAPYALVAFRDAAAADVLPTAAE